MSPSRERERPRHDERMHLTFRDERMDCPHRDQRTQHRERERPRRDERPSLEERARRGERPLLRHRSRSPGRESGPFYRLTLPLTRWASPRRGTVSRGQGDARQSSMPTTLDTRVLGTFANGRLHHHHHLPPQPRRKDTRAVPMIPASYGRVSAGHAPRPLAAGYTEIWGAGCG